MIVIESAEVECRCCGRRGEGITIVAGNTFTKHSMLTLCENCAMTLTDMLVERYGVKNGS